MVIVLYSSAVRGSFALSHSLFVVELLLSACIARPIEDTSSARRRVSCSTACAGEGPASAPGSGCVYRSKKKHRASPIEIGDRRLAAHDIIIPARRAPALPCAAHAAGPVGPDSRQKRSWLTVTDTPSARRSGPAHAYAYSRGPLLTRAYRHPPRASCRARPGSAPIQLQRTCVGAGAKAEGQGWPRMCDVP